MQGKVTFRDLLTIHSDRPDLIHKQVSALVRQIPILYSILSLNIVALAISYFGTAPLWLTVVCPGLAVTFAAVRSYSWIRFPIETDDHALNVKRLKSLTLLSCLLSLLLSSWALALYTYGNPFQQFHSAFFLTATMICCVMAVVQSPQASLMCLGIVTAVFFGRFVVSGNEVMLSVSINFLFLAALMPFVIRSFFSTFSAQIETTRDLQAFNDEMIRLNRDLEFLRHNLENEVAKRTWELEDHAERLEKALQRERELNELQNGFVSMVSHEFRTPLTIIDGMARRVEKRAEKLNPADVIERMAKVRAAVARLSTMVERTLDSTNLASGQIDISPQIYSPTDLLAKVIQRQAEVTPDRPVELETGQAPSRTYGDPRLMDHVYANLVSNAVKYSKIGDLVQVKVWEENDRLVVSVRDEGLGIPADELPKISARFYRASTAQGIQGTGVGLNLAVKLIELHKGRFEIDSREGEWTEIRVSVPLEPAFDDLQTDTHTETTAYTAA